MDKNKATIGCCVAAALCFKTSSAALPMKKAGACLIEFVGKPELAGGQLSAFLPPRLLRSRKHKVAS